MARYSRGVAHWSQLPCYRNSGHKVKIQLAAVAACMCMGDRGVGRGENRSTRLHEKRNPATGIVHSFIRRRHRCRRYRHPRQSFSLCMATENTSGCKPTCMQQHRLILCQLEAGTPKLRERSLPASVGTRDARAGRAIVRNARMTGRAYGIFANIPFLRRHSRKKSRSHP